MYKDEKIYEGEVRVKYVFKKTYKPNKNLIVVFSGFPAKGSPPSYNYGRTIEEFSCNKLFILDDFGARGSYYLCENKDFSIERSIISLINKIIKENDIETVVTAGSSKGGYAAIYYGIKYGFDHVIAASPQYYLGNYLVKEAKANSVAKFMAGNDNEEGIGFLNQIMEKLLIETTNRPNIFLHTGEGEPSYKLHISPMLNDFERTGINYTLDLGDYERHSEVKLFFPQLFKQKIRDYLDYPKLEVSVKKVNNGKLHRFTAETEKNNTVAWYLYHNNKRIEAIKYSPEKIYEFIPSKKGNYKMTVFVRNKKGLITSTTSPIIKI